MRKGVTMKNSSIRVIRSACRRVAAVAAGVVVGGALVAAVTSAGAAGAAVAGPPVMVNCSSSSLQTAIDNAAPGGILVVTGTCQGNFTIDKNLIVIGQGAAVLDGNAAGTTVSVGASAIVRIADLTVTGGASASGAGISNQGTLRLQDAVITNNSAREYGGGILNSGNGTLTIQGSSVMDNSGVGIVNFPGDTVTVQNSSVRDNNGLFGGGLANGGMMTLQNSVVSGNTAGIGAGIDNGGSLTLDGSTVTGNTALGFGGGIYNLDTVTLHGSSVTGNSPDNCNPLGSVAGCTG